jgi:hypothetical protein
MVRLEESLKCKILHIMENEENTWQVDISNDFLLKNDDDVNKGSVVDILYNDY